MRLESTLGPIELRSPLVAASGTVGSVVDAEAVIDFSLYGAAVAKSVAGSPWTGHASPRMAPTEGGMLTAIGIATPGIEAWAAEVGPQLAGLPVPVWGSAVGNPPDEVAVVAAGYTTAGVAAVEVNLSCPNLEGETMWALAAGLTAEAVGAVRTATDLPIGAKLSPNAPDVVPIAEAALAAGADWLVLTNTVTGAAIDIDQRRPAITRVTGGYSGSGMKPVALRCVVDVVRALGPTPIVGTGGVGSAGDAIEFLMAGASAVGIGTAHFADPKVAKKITRDFERWCANHGVTSPAELVGVGLEGVT